MLALAAMITAFLIAIGLNRSGAELSNAREDRNMNALRQAKTALIAYAASQQWQAYSGDPISQPGGLPCPDTGPDTTPGNTGVSSGICSTADARVGRLPFATIGSDDLRDASGERLWYAVSSTFYRNLSRPINSDTSGTLTVQGSAPANNVVAVVLAPGPPVLDSTLPGQVQNRSGNYNWTASYLEGYSVGANDYTFASNAFPFALASSAHPSDSYNDRLLVVTQADLMAVVEPVVAARIERDVKHFLTDYASQWHAFPFPAQFGNPGTSGSGSTRSPMTLIGDPSQQGGLLPLAYVEVTAATNASPITITTDSAHNLSNGSTVWISNVQGNIAANGRWTITVVDPTHFRLNGSSGSGNYTTGGVVRLGYAWGIASVNKAGGQGRIDNDSCTTVNSPFFGLSCTFRARDDDCGASFCISNLSFQIQTNVDQNAGRTFATLPAVSGVSTTIDGITTTFNSPSLNGSFNDNTGAGTVVYTATLPISCTSCSNHNIVVVIPDVAPSGISDTLNDPVNNKVLWFLVNEWYRQVYYAVAKDLLPGGAGSCPNTKPCLTVTNPPATVTTNNNIQAVLILAGRVLNGNPRPSAQVNDYLEGLNQTAVSVPTYVYEHRTGSPTSINDRVVVIAP
jgi:hypothetical protein